MRLVHAPLAPGSGLLWAGYGVNGVPEKDGPTPGLATSPLTPQHTRGHAAVQRPQTSA